jgi:hypothetical protein
VRILFIDNGDNKCFVYIENDTTKKQFNFMADFYIPMGELSNVMLAGKIYFNLKFSIWRSSFTTLSKNKTDTS